MPGSRVGESVAPSFALPDGRIMRLFHASHKRNARTPFAEPAETLPETLSGLGMQRLPQRPPPPLPNERDMPKVAHRVELTPPLPLKSLLVETHAPSSWGVPLKRPVFAPQAQALRRPLVLYAGAEGLPD